MNKKRKVLFITENASLLSGFGTYGAEVLKRLHATNKYDLAEFASYCKPQDPYVRNRPWPVYANAPSGKDKKEEKFFNNSDINQFGLWRFDRVCLDFKPDIVCVPPGTLIMTENGYKEIELIRPGEKVLTHTGRFQKVTENMRRMNKEPLVEIRVNGSCEPLVLTKEHPVYVYRQKPQTNKKKNRQEIYTDAIPEFVEAGHINIGDLIISISPITPIYMNNINEYLDVTDYLDDYIIKSDNKVYASQQCTNGIPRYIPLNGNFGKLIGYFITDGGLRDDYHARLHFKVGEERFINDSKELLEQYFDIKSYIQNPEHNKNKYILSIGSLTLLNFLKKFIGYPRHIPSITWSTTKDFREGILCGMVRGDGTYAKKCIRLTTTNKYLMNEYRLLCFSVGIRVHNRYKKRYSDKHNTTWELETNGFDCLKLHNIAQKYDKCPVENSRFNTKTSTNILNNGYFITPVKTINNIDHEGLVYNLSVENDESYTIQQSIVHNCTLRDPWMDNWVADSPVRDYFHWVWMPTVDSAPQRPYWIDVFTKCDAVFTYSEFGIRTLEEQGRDKINLKGCASPGIDSNIFKPVMDKRAHRNAMGISPDINIVGTVMRNQKRKLFSELMQAFRLFLDTTDKETAKKTFLYLHTSYPEKNGWDLPELILENGISSKVLATYICKHCKNVFVSFFADARTICKHCGQHSAIFPNVVHGASTEQLVKIYNCFDVYVQYAIAEGFGCPIIEAAACGIPVMCVDFTAMHDVVRWCKGYPIKVGYVFRELETGANRCYPDNEHLSQLLHKFFKLPNQIRKQKGFQARQGCIKRYNWDETAKKWEDHFDSLELKEKQGKWNSPPEIFQPNMNVPDKMSQEQAIAWVLANIANKPQEIYKFKGMIASRDISFGATFSYGYIQEFDMKKFIAQCKAYIENKNTIEKIKAGMVGLPPADYIQAAHK